VALRPQGGVTWSLGVATRRTVFPPRRPTSAHSPGRGQGRRRCGTTRVVLSAMARR